MDITSEVYANDDKHGNRIYMRVFFNENKQPTASTIYLKLAKESRFRQLGNYYFETKTFFCKRKTEKHYHYVSKSFGFNWTIIDDAMLDIAKIHLVVDDQRHYLFPKSMLADYGKFLNFKEQGFELQRFLSFGLIKNYEIKNNTDVEQPSKASGGE